MGVPNYKGLSETLLSNLTSQYCTEGYKGGGEIKNSMNKIPPRPINFLRQTSGSRRTSWSMRRDRFAQRNLAGIFLLNQTQIRLYLPCTMVNL